MGPFGFQELVVILLVALLVFGPRKLPELGKSLGKGLREFRKASNELKSTWEDQIRDAESSVSDVKQTFKQTGAEINENLNKSVQTVDAPPPESSETIAASGETVLAEEIREEVKSDGRPN